MFTTPLELKSLKGGKYQLLSDLVFKHRGVTITTHKGFVWDLANIPSYLREEIGCPMEFACESCSHDVLYGAGLFSREKSDTYWYLALRSGGEYKESVGKIRAKALYAGVRIGGSSHYKTEDISKMREFVSVSMRSL